MCQYLSTRPAARAALPSRGVFVVITRDLSLPSRSLPVGTTVEVSDTVAQHWIDQGWARTPGPSRYRLPRRAS